MGEERDGASKANGLLEGTPVFVKELIAGGVAGGFAKTVVAPLERVKILFQVSHEGFLEGVVIYGVIVFSIYLEGFGKLELSTISGTLDFVVALTRRAEFHSIGLSGSFSKIAKTEGLLGFYRGNGASVARIVPYAALHYMAYEEYRRWIILGFPEAGRGPVLDLIAGSFAGGTAVLFTYPLDLVRTKLAYQVVESSKTAVKRHVQKDRVYNGIRDCFSKIYKEAGMRGLYRGVAPSLYGIFPYAGLKFYFYEEMKRHVPEDHRKDITVKLVCGSVAGLLGQTFTYPLDVVRRQMQVQRLMISESSSTKGTVESLVTIVRTQGWKQLFSGLSINYLKVVPSVAIGFTVYDVMKAYLQVPSRDEIESERRHNQPSSLPSSPSLSQTQQ